MQTKPAADGISEVKMGRSALVLIRCPHPPTAGPAR